MELRRNLARGLARACQHALETQCVQTVGDWRLGPVDAEWDVERAVDVIAAAIERGMELMEGRGRKVTDAVSGPTAPPIAQTCDGSRNFSTTAGSGPATETS